MVAPAPADPRGPPRRLGVERTSALLLTLLAPAAFAQVSGNVALLSDYRYRGVSLSDGKPAAQLGLVYDDPRSWYAGAVASTALAHCTGACGSLQVVAYAGYAARQASGLTLEAGGDFSFSLARQGYNYPEAYLGLAYANFSARAYWSPRYFGQDARSTYVEMNQVLPLREHVRLLGHVGLLRVSNAAAYPYSMGPATRTDVLLGVGFDVASFEVQASWQHAGAEAAIYPAPAQERRSRFAVQVSRAF